MGRASPLGNQGGQEQHAVARSCGSSTRTCCLASADVDLRHSPAPTPGRPGEDRGAQGVHHCREGPHLAGAVVPLCPLVIVEGLEANPASDLDVVAEPKPPVNHNPYLHLPELPEFLHKLRLYNPRGWQTQLGIRLLFLTGVRTGELRLAAPDQCSDPRPWPVDHPAADRQATPGRVRKAGKRPQDVPPYIVPLSVQAIEIVLPVGCDEAGSGPSAHAPQRTQEAHQREHPSTRP
ncbi:hypothetical protein ACPA9J_03915 [Pseudomonas aeruginosa]